MNNLRLAQNRMNPEWKYIQFRLQLILSNPNIQIVSISKNPTAEINLGQKQNYLKIDGAINVTDESSQIIQQLKNNLKKGSIFKCGRISQQPIYSDGLGNPKTYKIIFFKLVIRNLLAVYKTNLVSKQDFIDFTQQYDSIYLANPKEQISVYQHDYLVKATSQYKWEYEIEYRYVNNQNNNEINLKYKKWKPEQYQCQQCRQNKAVYFCKNQKLLFCRDCYEDVHKGRNRVSHKKQPISSFNCYKKCQRANHQENPLFYFCFLCKQSKCDKCFNDSVHSKIGLKELQMKDKLFIEHQSQYQTRKKTNHEYAEIQNLMIFYKMRQQLVNTQLKNKITSKIKQIENIISLLSNDYQKNLKNLEEAFRIQIIKLKRQSRKQINQAVSIHINLKRKYDQTLWMQKYIEHNERILDIESNINLKQLSNNYLQMMKAQKYFDKIDQKICKIKKTLI